MKITIGTAGNARDVEVREVISVRRDGGEFIVRMLLADDTGSAEVVMQFDELPGWLMEAVQPS